MQDYDAEQYANANAVVAQLKYQRAHIWQHITEDTLTTHTAYDDRIHATAPRLQSLVEKADLAERALTTEIERWRLRGHLYHTWIAAHPQHTGDELQAELFQIDTYVAYHTGYEPPEEQPDAAASVLDNVATMAAYFQ